MPADTGIRKGMLPMTLEAAAQKDWVRQPLTILLWWGLPVVILAETDIFHLSFRADAGLCAFLLGWMATGCLLNVRRCHRVHCYISGTVLLVGAAFAGIVALGELTLSVRTFDNTISVVLVLALLSFVPELLWRRYA